jgi:predicted nucleic acid-binding protein
MNVLVDTSVWIDYLRVGTRSQTLDILIDENLIVVNELILSELIPTLALQGQSKFISLLQLLPTQPILIDWNEIRLMQTRCLKKGFNGIGIADLIIAQNAIQHHTPLYTLDKHFRLLVEITPLNLL